MILVEQSGSSVEKETGRQTDRHGKRQIERERARRLCILTCICILIFQGYGVFLGDITKQYRNQIINKGDKLLIIATRYESLFIFRKSDKDHVANNITS